MIVPTIVLVEDDAAELKALRMILAREGSFEVHTATNGVEAVDLIAALHPDVIISDYEMPEMDGFSLCRRVKQDPQTASAMFLVLTAHDDTVLKVRGLNLGVDDFLMKPVEAPELIAKIRATVRIKELHDTLRQDQEEMAKLHRELAASFDQLITLLVHLVDLAEPGAADRGHRIARMALQVAQRMTVPEVFLRPLEIAARLHEIGKLCDLDPGEDSDEAGPGDPGGEHGWRYVLFSQAILQQVEGLKEAAELVSGVYENWDGTGLPKRLRQGQIPVRTRILRTLIDFLSEVDKSEAEVQEIVAGLHRRSGTLYDPVVVAHVETVINETPDLHPHSVRRRVPVRQLQEGMVLAEDLVTSSGAKLLSGGSTMSANALQIIRRRHQSDPVIFGAWVSQ